MNAWRRIEAGSSPSKAEGCSRITFDAYSPPLVLGFLYDGPPARVEINVPFRYEDASGSRVIDPFADNAALAPLLSRIGRSIRVAVADEDGGLHLGFSDGASIDVDPPEGISEPWWFDMDDEIDDPTPDRE